MRKYFSGAIIFGPYNILIDGQEILFKWTEKWFDVDESRTIRCVKSREFKFSKTTGIEQKELERFTDYVEGSLGPAAIATIKSHMENQIGREIAFSESSTITDTAEFEGRGCGRQTLFVYQLFRDYEFVFNKPRPFRKPLIIRKTMRDRTNNFDIRCETDPDDESCPCLPPDLNHGSDEIASFKIGSLTLRVDAKRTGDSVSFWLGALKYIATPGAGDRFLVDIDTKSLPAAIRFFSQTHEETIRAQVDLLDDEAMKYLNFAFASPLEEAWLASLARKVTGDETYGVEPEKRKAEPEESGV